MSRRRRPAPGAPHRAAATFSPGELADRLHSAAIHLLRRLRTEDPSSGLTAPRASALSVLVFGGPRTLTGLAAVEQVRPPTMSRLVTDLEREGFVARVPDPADRRVQWIHPTALAKRLLQEGRARRVARLEQDLRWLRPDEFRALAQGAVVLEQVARPIGERVGGRKGDRREETKNRG